MFLKALLPVLFVQKTACNVCPCKSSFPDLALAKLANRNFQQRPQRFSSQDIHAFAVTEAESV